MRKTKSEPAGIVGRFADPNQWVIVPLGPCRCPGTPHLQGDSAQMRAEIGDGELRAATTRGGFSSGLNFNGAQSDDECIATFTRAWTLTDGERDKNRQLLEVPITPAAASLLDEATRDALLEQIQKASATRRALPNVPGAPSPDSSEESASPSQDPTTA
jgi:hypothetical protein